MENCSVCGEELHGKNVQRCRHCDQVFCPDHFDDHDCPDQPNDHWYSWFNLPISKYVGYSISTVLGYIGFHHILQAFALMLNEGTAGEGIAAVMQMSVAAGSFSAATFAMLATYIYNHGK